MKRFELLLFTLSVLAVSSLLLRFSGGVYFTQFGLSLLAMFYFLCGFILLGGIPYQDIFRNSSFSRLNRLEMLYLVLSSLVLAFLLTAIQLKLLLYTGSDFMLGISLGASLFILVAGLLLHKWMQKLLLKRVLLRISVYASVSLLLLITPAFSLIDQYSGKNTELAQIRKQIWDNPYDDGLSRHLSSLDSNKQPIRLFPFSNILMPY
ncbi:MAG: hypothetical protein ACK5Z2_01040 [Bacteroidota bacterium]|jgi:hypothetical protein